MEIIVSILSVVSQIILIISLILIVIKVYKYYTDKYKLEYKNHLLNLGLKAYVDKTLNEYIIDSLEEEIKINPDFINKIVLTPDDEQTLLKIITTNVLEFMSDTFKEQLRSVYNIDIILEEGQDGLTDIVTRKTYIQILELSIKMNTPRNTNVNIQKMMNQE